MLPSPKPTRRLGRQRRGKRTHERGGMACAGKRGRGYDGEVPEAVSRGCWAQRTRHQRTDTLQRFEKGAPTDRAKAGGGGGPSLLLTDPNFARIWIWSDNFRG